MANEKKPAIREPFTKAKLFAAISEETGVAKRDVVAVFGALNDIAERHLRSRGAGVFTVPGLAKITVVKKKATKERKGVNPFTGQAITIAAKPARRAVRVRALKNLKAMAD